MHLKEEIALYLFKEFTNFQKVILLFCKKWVDNEFDPGLYTYVHLVVMKKLWR